MMNEKLDAFTVFSVMSDPLIASEAHGPDAFYSNDTEETEAGWKNYISDQIERFQRGRYEEAGKALEKIMYDYVESAIDANPHLVAQQYEKDQIADHHTMHDSILTRANEVHASAMRSIESMDDAVNEFTDYTDSLFEETVKTSYGDKYELIKGEEK